MGIGTPIAERPSHTAIRTGHVYDDLAADTAKRTVVLPGLPERDDTGLSATAALDR